MSDLENTELTDFYQKIAAEAAARAAIEIVTWVPLMFGDHTCGKVVDSSTIELPSLRNPGDIDVWPTSTIVPIGEIVMDGATLDLTDKVLRVAWLGPVLVRQYQTLRPDTGDVVAMHYQRDETPKSGLNDYKLVNSVVFDGTTGKPKKSIELTDLHKLALNSSYGKSAYPPDMVLETGELVTTPAFDKSNEKLDQPVKPGKK